jgi:hypothetical protein
MRDKTVYEESGIAITFDELISGKNHIKHEIDTSQKPICLCTIKQKIILKFMKNNVCREIY